MFIYLLVCTCAHQSPGVSVSLYMYIPHLQASFKSDHGPSPQVPGVVASDDNGLSNGTFTHTVAHAGKEVSVKALRHGDHLFVYLSSRATELSKEWYVLCTCIPYTCTTRC